MGLKFIITVQACYLSGKIPPGGEWPEKMDADIQTLNEKDKGFWEATTDARLCRSKREKAKV